MRSSDIQHLMQLIAACREQLKKCDIAKLETTIPLLMKKAEGAFKEKSSSGFTNHLVYGACAGFGDRQAASAFLREVSEKTDEKLLYLHRMNSEIEGLEVAFHTLKGMHHFQSGHHKTAFSEWENALRKAPSGKAIHRRLSDIVEQAGFDVKGGRRSRETAAVLRRRYCFEEDGGFWERLASRLPDPAVRCIDFDDDGDMYLNCVNRHSVVKLNSDAKIEWEVRFDGPNQKMEMKRPSEFGSFCFSVGRLVLCDTSNRQLILLNKGGVVERAVPLQAGIPLFAHYVEDLRQYHITDEQSGTVHRLDEGFREIGAYRSPDEALRPVQVVRAKAANRMVLASGLVLIRSALDIFDMNGNHKNTITSFSGSPCHVVKLDTDSCGTIYAADHFGRIFKINTSGKVIWSYRESPMSDRFKYLKYQRPYLYLSDSHTVRRFRVDR